LKVNFVIKLKKLTSSMSMRKISVILLFFCFLAVSNAFADRKLLIPMDEEQTDHLKAYGVAYYSLEMGYNVEWLLNYRCGSFLIPDSDKIKEYALLRGVKCIGVGDAELKEIDDTINNSNMSRELLEKAPKIAVYTPPGKQPWDDAVT